jgi:hypothetical protein
MLRYQRSPMLRNSAKAKSPYLYMVGVTGSIPVPPTIFSIPFGSLAQVSVLLEAGRIAMIVPG